MQLLGTIVEELRCNDGPGIRTTHDFLQKLTENLFSNVQDYRDSTGEIPLCFKEKQILPLIGSAIQKTTPAFLGEVPIQRSAIFRNTKSTPGFVDFWATYRNTSFFIEVKHCFFSYHSKKVNKDLLDKWKTAANQLASSKKALNDGWNIRKESVLLSLMITPFYISESAANHRQLDFTHEHIGECNSTIISELKPDWYSICSLNKQYYGPYEYTKSTEYHPAIGIYVKIINCTK